MESDNIVGGTPFGSRHVKAILNVKETLKLIFLTLFKDRTGK